MTPVSRETEQLQATLADLEQRKATEVQEKARADQARIDNSLGAETGDADAAALFEKASLEAAAATRRIEALNLALAEAGSRLSQAMARATAAMRERTVKTLRRDDRELVEDFGELERELNAVIARVEKIKASTARSIARRSEIAGWTMAGKQARDMFIRGMTSDLDGWKVRVNELLTVRGVAGPDGLLQTKFVPFAQQGQTLAERQAAVLRTHDPVAIGAEDTQAALPPAA